MSKLPTLNEAFKFTVEFDPGGSDVQKPVGPQCGHDEEEDIIDMEPMASEGRRSPYSSGYMGNCTRVVSEVAGDSRLRQDLSEVAREVDRVVSETVEDIGYRGDKREYLAAEHWANERVYRSWRSFLRELADFEKRFR